MRLPVTRITLLKSTPKVKITLDRFSETWRMSVHHVDFAVDRINAILRRYVKIEHKDYSCDSITSGLRLVGSIQHKDVDISSVQRLRCNVRMPIRHIDIQNDGIKSTIRRWSRIEHTDVSVDSIISHYGRPRLLGEIAVMTLDSTGSFTMGELMYEEI